MKAHDYLETAITILLLVAVAACNDKSEQLGSMQPDSNITIIFDEEKIPTPVIEQAGGTATVVFTATDIWEAEVNAVTRTADWISIQPTQGEAGSVNLHITAHPNDTYDERNAAVFITCGGQQKILTVSQKQQNALLVTSNKVELNTEGGNFNIEVQANVTVDCSIEKGVDWLTAVDTSSRVLTETVFTFHADENKSTNMRQATLTLTGSGLTEQVTVYQLGSSSTLILGQHKYLVSSEGEIIQVELRSNITYDVKLPAVDWIKEANSRSLSAYTHYFTIAPNDTYDNRTAQIVFTNETENIADTLTVIQMQQDAIVLAQNEYTVLAAEDTLTFPVLTNVEITTTTDVEWITPLPITRALQENQLSFHIAALPDTVDRQGIITLSGNGSTQQIIVKQLYEEPKLVNVKYRTGYLWEEAHDNLPLLYYAYVERDRYYDNGEIVTDRFMDAGHPVELYAGCSLADATDFSIMKENEYEYKFADTEETIVYHREFINGKYFYEGDDLGFHNDSILTYNCAVELDYLNRIEAKEHWLTDEENNGSYPGKWDAYVTSKQYDDGVYLYISPDEYPSEHERTDLPNGWYFQGFAGTIDQAYVHYNSLNHNGDNSVIYRVNMFLRCYDQFLVIDGRRIDFLDYLPERKYNMTTEDLPETNEYVGGKRYTRKLHAKFLGRNFYMTTTMDFYAAKNKYQPNELYYFSGSDSDIDFNWSTDVNDYNWLFMKSNGYDKSKKTFTTEATQAPIVSADDWITIHSVTKNNQVEGPVQLSVYNWDITWSLDNNLSGKDRNGYIYLKNKQGEIKRKVKIMQPPIYEDELFGTVDFVGNDYSGGWGPWEIRQDWRNSGILTYHKKNSACITPTLIGVDTSGWPGLSWQEQENDIVFQITLNTGIQQPRTAVIHLLFEGVPFNITLTQEGCPNEELLEIY